MEFYNHSKMENELQPDFHHGLYVQPAVKQMHSHHLQGATPEINEKEEKKTDRQRLLSFLKRLGEIYHLKRVMLTDGPVMWHSLGVLFNTQCYIRKIQLKCYLLLCIMHNDHKENPGKMRGKKSNHFFCIYVCLQKATLPKPCKT